MSHHVEEFDVSVCEDTSTWHLLYHIIILILFLSPCTSLSAVPQICHSGNVLGFCFKGMRQVEAALIFWLNNITCK